MNEWLLPSAGLLTI